MVNEETTNQDPENEPIRNLLAGLKRVEAPKDFDFHVRARIAKGRPAERTTSWLPVAVRYAVPMLLLLTIGGYFGFRSFYSNGQSNAPLVATAPTVSPDVSAPPVAPVQNVPSETPSNNLVAESVEPKAPETHNDVKVKQMDKTVPAKNTKTEQPGGGSMDLSGTGTKTIVAPDVNTNSSSNKAPKSPVKDLWLSENDFLSANGVTATVLAAGGRVTGVPGVAARSGIKEGDMI